MTCIEPPELSDESLLKVLDGEVDEQVERHLQECEHCRARAQALAQLQGNLTKSLYRFDCPASSTLGEYHLGLLSPSDAEGVRIHLERCPHCLAELGRLESYLNSLQGDLDLHPVERVKVWIARLVGGGEGASGVVPQFAPAVAGLRGAPQEPRIYTVEDLQIAVDVQEDDENPGNFVLLGLATGRDTQGWVVEIWQKERRVAEVVLDPTEKFLFNNIPPGEYVLILGDEELEVHVPDVQVGV
jgi:hypothetical protein